VCGDEPARFTFEYGGDLDQAVAQLNALADGLI